MVYAHQVFTNISQTMNGGIQMLSPSSYLTNNPSWLFEENKGSKWTHEENKLFENALALFDKDTPDRWYNVAAMIPGKTVSDVIRQYRELEDDVSDIEAGLIPVPGYDDSSSFTLEWVTTTQGFDASNQFYNCSGKRSSSARIPDQERKKGVPWTVEEHRQFLMGLKKYGKGDWRNISRNFVTTRTPTQVASHAQKYFIRQLSGGKDKRRSSIHDITTVNLAGNKSFSPEDNINTTSPPDLSSCSKVAHNLDKALHHWNPTCQVASTAFDLQNSSLIMGSTCGTSSYGYKLQEQSIERGPQFGVHNSNFFQMHPIQYQ